ncbi:hypothetical protein D5085_15140 [Ectothiorhodospiraceae bacterium BW-2]|nr:hypothetical protein D5085_15140 [Ectothiorhodospiraceae bacterium BW-2]
MDETEYKQTYSHYNPTPCAFSKAVLRRCCGCRYAQKLLIAEREAVSCLSPDTGYPRCYQLLPQLRTKAMFSLRLKHAVEGVLPHGKEVKVQCGSMLGLQQLLQPAKSGSERVADIFALLDLAESIYGDYRSLPYSELVKAISHFSVRSRSPRP